MNVAMWFVNSTTLKCVRRSSITTWKSTVLEVLDFVHADLTLRSSINYIMYWIDISSVHPLFDHWSSLSMYIFRLYAVFKNCFCTNVIEGEVNESQKKELEKNKFKIQEQEREIKQNRLKITSLSQTIDQQSDTIKKLKSEIRWIYWNNWSLLHVTR